MQEKKKKKTVGEIKLVHQENFQIMSLEQSIALFFRKQTIKWRLFK